MKKFKKLSYIVLIMIIAILGLTIYTNASKQNESDIKEKTLSQIEYIETKLVSIFNKLNHVEFENYDISISEITSKSSENTSQGSSSSEGTQGGGSSSNSSSSGDSSGSENSQSSGDSNNNVNNEKFGLKSSGILNNQKEIDWSTIKDEIEVLYTSIPVITLDLYEFNTTQEDILKFNQEIDNLTISVKNEDKQTTLDQLYKVYEFIPVFLKNASIDELEQNNYETKMHIFLAYSKLDTNNWSEISKNINSAIETYSKNLTNSKIEEYKQGHVNKIYIMLNEMQNAVNIQDKDIFLIKYKNVLEELNKI